MAAEFGVFNDEGLIDGPHYSLADANAAMFEWAARDEPNLSVAEICPEHPEAARLSCEECYGEEDDDEGDEDDDEDM